MIMRSEFRVHNVNGRRQTVIYADNNVIAVLETFGIESHLEEYKKHIERVMSAYVVCINTLQAGSVNTYTPKKINGFEYRLSNGETVALLKYNGIEIAQINIRTLNANMDVTLRYIYKVMQSFLKYMGKGEGH